MTILTLNPVKLITITISTIKTITTITRLPSVMGGSRSRQPRQLRRPFSSKGTFQGGNQNTFDRWSCERLKRKKEVSLWATKTANLFNCSCPSYTPPTSCLIAPTLPTACLSVRTCSIPPPRNSSQGRNQGTRLSNQIPPPPPPRVNWNVWTFSAKTAKRYVPPKHFLTHVVVNVFSLDIKLKTHQDCHVIYQSTLPSPAELQFLFHFWSVHILQANKNFIFYHVR